MMKYQSFAAPALIRPKPDQHPDLKRYAAAGLVYCAV
jgi:hypothetical protein